MGRPAPTGVTAPINGDGGIWATYVTSGTTAPIELIFDVTGFYGVGSINGPG